MADHKVEDLFPDEVSKGIAEGRYLLVDVREPNEVAVEAYPDGVVVPLQCEYFALEGVSELLTTVRRVRDWVSLCQGGSAIGLDWREAMQHEVLPMLNL